MLQVDGNPYQGCVFCRQRLGYLPNNVPENKRIAWLNQ
jgi:hypothetical protein